MVEAAKLCEMDASQDAASGRAGTAGGRAADVLADARRGVELACRRVFVEEE
jgi:hypothetical protein